jgi:hypothetical protein
MSRNRANCGVTVTGTYRGSVTTVTTRRRSFLRVTVLQKHAFRNFRNPVMGLRRYGLKALRLRNKEIDFG